MMALISKRARVGGLIVFGRAVVTSLATVTGVSLASAGSHDHHLVPASSLGDSAAVPGKGGPAVVPKITYPAEGVDVSASAPSSPGHLASPASSPKTALTSFRRQVAPQHVLGSILTSQAPIINLRVVTELTQYRPT